MPKGDQINWNSTRALQVICCMACELYERQRGGEGNERVDKEQFLKEMKHHFPRWRDYIPDWVAQSGLHMDDRLFKKAYEMANNERYHPTHINNTYTSGRYWDAVLAHLNSPLEFTPKDETMQKLIDTVPTSILMGLPAEVDRIVETIGNLREALDVMIMTIERATDRTIDSDEL